jgi:hypothetical protein
MPPKLPNLKFKPKSDPRIKSEAEDLDDPEMMSLVQRERLKQLQLQAEKEQQVQRAAVGQVRAELGGGNPAPGGPSIGGASRGNDGRVKPEGSSGGGGGGGSGMSSKIVRDSAKLQHQIAAVAASQFTAASSASHLPHNNMEAVLCSESNNDLPASLIRPVALSTAGSAVSMNKAPSDGADHVDPNVGTAFLEDWRVESDHGRAQNRHFFGMSDPAVAQASSSAGVSSMVHPKETELVWLQLPRGAHAADPTKAGANYLSLKQMPAGRIGQLRVHRSGRCVLVFDNGLELEVSSSSVGDARGGMSQVAVATLPPMNPGEPPMAFELGPVISKMVCTPNVNTDV